MGTPFSVTVFGGRAGAGGSDGSFSVPAGKVYLGHRSIQSTVRYTELAPGRFKNLWRS